MPIQETGLYNATDNIVLLNVTNIKSTILASKSSWIVEFYSSWCGHCQRFAPVWKSFAKDVLGIYCLNYFVNTILNTFNAT